MNNDIFVIFFFNAFISYYTGWELQSKLNWSDKSGNPCFVPSLMRKIKCFSMKWFFITAFYQVEKIPLYS